MNSSQRHIVYKSNNYLIRWIGRIFFSKVDALLCSFDARSKFGADIGCGESHLLHILRENKTIGPVIAYDLSAENLENAQKEYPDFPFTRGDAQKIAFQDNSFDYVIALEILEHVPSPNKVLEEIQRVSKPESKIIISVPNEPFFHLGNMLRGKYISRFGKTPNHLSFWSVSQFQAMLADYFAIERRYVFSVFPWQLYLCRSNKN